MTRGAEPVNDRRPYGLRSCGLGAEHLAELGADGFGGADQVRVVMPQVMSALL